MKTKEDEVEFLVISSAYPYRGGISDSTHSFCNELTNSGTKLEVWTFSYLYPKLLFPGRTQYSSEKYVQKFKIKRQINTINPINWFRIALEINRMKPVNIVLRYWSPILAPAYFFICSLIDKRINIIGMVDNWHSHENVMFDSLFRKLFVSVCKRFVTLSDNVGDQIVKSTRKEVTSLFHPINSNLPKIKSKKIALEKLNLSQSFKYISFIGLIREYKGLKTLILSMQFLPNNIRLIISGEFYEPIEKYLNIIENNNLKDRVIINSSFVDSTEIRDYICASDLIILPYLRASQSGIIPLAYLYNKPIVVSNVKGLKEIIKKDKTGEIFNKSPLNLSEVILKCLVKENYNNYKLNIKKFKSDYSWSEFIRRFKLN
tara:strand:- start:3462 stop:4583 length:1122 start_codon:yes stop_codon:yes gene_type:complete